MSAMVESLGFDAVGIVGHDWGARVRTAGTWTARRGSTGWHCWTSCKPARRDGG
ncbi:hypothetical protein ACWDKQ_17805 [Saccharopolyspora sp. NPDC000995]